MSEKIILVAVAMIFIGVTMTVFCIALIHGTIYGLLAAGIGFVLVGIGIILIPWDPE